MRPGISAVVMTMSCFLIVSAISAALLFLVRGAHLLGVAAGGLGLLELVVLDRDEGGAERLHLLLGGRTHVGRGHDAAQAPCRGDGLEAGDADAHDHDAGRRHGAGGGHHHGKGAAEFRRRIDDGAISRQIGLAGQHVHRLGAGDAGHQFHREGVDLGVGVGLELITLLIGLKNGDQHGAGLHQRQFVRAPLRPPSMGAAP